MSGKQRACESKGHHQPVGEAVSFTTVIRSQPDEAVNYLVFADWLGEKGFPDCETYCREVAVCVRHGQRVSRAGFRVAEASSPFLWLLWEIGDPDTRATLFTHHCFLHNDLAPLHDWLRGQYESKLDGDEEEMDCWRRFHETNLENLSLHNGIYDLSSFFGIGGCAADPLDANPFPVMTVRSYTEQRWLSQVVWEPSRGMTAEEASAEYGRWCALERSLSGATNLDKRLITAAGKVLCHSSNLVAARLAGEWHVAAESRKDDDLATYREELRRKNEEQRIRQLKGQLKGVRTLLGRGERWKAWKMLTPLTSARTDSLVRTEARQLMAEISGSPEGVPQPPVGSIWEKRANKRKAKQARHRSDAPGPWLAPEAH